MKKCPYCGRHYSDEAQVCPTDQNLLVCARAERAPAPNTLPGRLRSPLLGRAGRWLIFAGIPVAVAALLFVTTEAHHKLESAVGKQALPYVLFFTPGVIVILGRLLYERVPKRLVVPLGIAGWALGFALLCWFFWFGPGAWRW